MAAKERGEEDRDAFERDGGWAGHGVSGARRPIYSRSVSVRSGAKANYSTSA